MPQIFDQPRGILGTRSSRVPLCQSATIRKTHHGARPHPARSQNGRHDRSHPTRPGDSSMARFRIHPAVSESGPCRAKQSCVGSLREVGGELPETARNISGLAFNRSTRHWLQRPRSSAWSGDRVPFVLASRQKYTVEPGTLSWRSAF